METGCDGLPNKNELGMLLEFNGCDSGGLRSSLTYSGQGWSINNVTNYLLLYFGYPSIGTLA